MPQDFRWVDPRELRLSISRPGGADLAKLQRQFSKHGLKTKGMPALWVEESPDGFLRILDGDTRATRIAKYLPGTMVLVEVTDRTPDLLANQPLVGDHLP